MDVYLGLNESEVRGWTAKANLATKNDALCIHGVVKRLRIVPAASVT